MFRVREEVHPGTPTGRPALSSRKHIVIKARLAIIGTPRNVNSSKEASAPTDVNASLPSRTRTRQKMKRNLRKLKPETNPSQLRSIRDTAQELTHFLRTSGMAADVDQSTVDAAENAFHTFLVEVSDDLDDVVPKLKRRRYRSETPSRLLVVPAPPKNPRAVRFTSLPPTAAPKADTATVTVRVPTMRRNSDEDAGEWHETLPLASSSATTTQPPDETTILFYHRCNKPRPWGTVPQCWNLLCTFLSFHQRFLWEET